MHVRTWHAWKEHVHEHCCMHVWHISDCQLDLERSQGSSCMSGPCMFYVIKSCVFTCVCVCERESVCPWCSISVCVCIYAYAYIIVAYVCVRVADSPVGLSGCGLAAGEVAEQTQRGLSLLAHLAHKRLSRLTSYSVTVANEPTGTAWDRVSQDLHVGPAGHLGDRDSHGT